VPFAPREDAAISLRAPLAAPGAAGCRADDTARLANHVRIGGLYVGLTALAFRGGSSHVALLVQVK